MMDACSFGFGCSEDAAWFPFGFGLVLPVLACWFLLGSLAVRSSGPVLDGVDGVLDAWFAWIVSSVGFASGSFGEERLAYIYRRTLYIDFSSLHAAIHLIFQFVPSPLP
jgi:hypothetical protein